MLKKFFSMFLVLALVFSMVLAFAITTIAAEPAVGEAGETQIVSTAAENAEEAEPEQEAEAEPEQEAEAEPEQEPAEEDLNSMSAPDYLCFTGTGAFTVSMQNVDHYGTEAPAVNLEYCTGDCSVPENWSTFTVGETEVQSADGSPVYFRGSGNARFAGVHNELQEHNNFVLTAGAEGVTVAASGNIMTLLDHDPVPEALAEGNESAFAGLFKDCAILTDAPDLPSLVTVHACYLNMFMDCALLTKVPDLPANNLADYCCYGMFMRCTALKNGPQMSDEITTAGVCSCEDMFFYCTALTKAPDVLSATKLSFGSYRCMFWYCTSLERAPEMTIEEVGDDSCCSMFNNCTSLEEVPFELNATALGWRVYGSMFYNCRSLGEVLSLEFESFANESCRQMFYDCKRMLISEGSAQDYDWKIPASTAQVPVEDMGYGTASGSVTVEVPESGYNYYKVDILPWTCFIDKNKNGTREEGEPRYISLDDAVYDVEEGVEENIVLFCDCKATVSIWASKNIVLDLNDHVLSREDTDRYVIKTGGSLTIKGAGDTQGSTIHKWVPNNDPTDDIPDGLWVMNDEASGTEGVDYFVTKGGVITGGADSGLQASGTASLKLENVNIIGNTNADGEGGGIYSTSTASLQIVGGRISGNVSANGGGVGGVYVEPYDDKACPEITLGGDAVINENKGALADNLAFALGKGNISLQDPADGMKVGVSLIKDNACTGGVFAKNSSKDDAKYFFSASDCYMVGEDSGILSPQEDSLTAQSGIQLALVSRISQQPAPGNNYTVGVDMTGLSYKSLSYQWVKPATKVSCTVDMFEEEIGESGISGFDYDAAKDTYSSVEESGGYLALQPTEECAGNMDTVSFKVDTENDYLLDCSDMFSPIPIEPDKDGYYTMKIGDIALLGISGCLIMACDGQYTPQALTISDLTYSGMSPVEGQTEARLTVAEAGTYQCRVIFEDGSAVDSEAVEFVPHSHDWTYEASGATITAVCLGSGVCDATDTTLTLLAPELNTYGDDESEEATLSAESLAGLSELPTIHYARKTESGTYEGLKEAPTGAGSYMAFITVNNAGVDVTAYVEYTIAKKTINVKADDKTSVAGTDLVSLTYTADKLVGSDKFTGALATNANKNTVGKYEITRGTLTAGDNYSIVFTNGTYAVTASNNGTPSANTGDTNNPGMYVLIVLAAIGVIFAVVAVNKKRRAK